MAARVGGQDFNLWLDTGSSVLAVSAEGCEECQDHGVDQFYDLDHGVPEASWVRRSYGAGTWSGWAYSDTVEVVGVPAITMTFAAVTSESGAMFAHIDCDGVGTSVDGILGLGPRGGLPWPTEYYPAALEHQAAVPRPFALRLCHAGGTLWMGGYDPSAMTDEVEFVALDSEAHDWIDVVSISIESHDGNSVTVPISEAGGSVPGLLDSGFDTLSLPPAAFDAIVAAIVADPAFSAIGDAEFLGANSWMESELTPTEVDAALPGLVVELAGSPGGRVSVPATESYLTWRQREPGVYRYNSALFRGSSEFLDLGDFLFHSYVVYTDRENQRVGFAPAVPCEDEE